MNPSIAALVELQSTDLNILRLKEMLEQKPRALASGEQEVARQRERLDQKHSEIKDQQVKIALKEDDLKDHEARIAKLKAQQATRGIKNKEFQALSHEIEGEKANTSYLQDVLLQMYAELEKVQKEVEELKKGVDSARDALEEQRAAIEAEIKTLQLEVEALEQQRTASAENLDEEIVNRYERILKGKKDIALAEVLDNHCQGCYMELTPQMMLLVRKGSELVMCQSCGRLLYLP
ncbi:MAG: hypothetical protein HYU36_10090 [Planctomycetes bacterium]|nr:hypothetical protein [Planctomycetota bacterium]